MRAEILNMKRAQSNFHFPNLAIATTLLIIELLVALPAKAHHPLDGRLPSNFLEGLISGFGHPIVGYDHLAFVIASGLVAVGITRGIIIPITFVLATAIGMEIHLLSIDLPIPEIIIAASVVLFGILLITRNKPVKTNYTWYVSGLAAIAGIFHGHAYGEGIFGAEATPLIAYLIGFTLIQLVISLGVYFVASKAIAKISLKDLTSITGVIILATGMIFLSSAITG